VFPGLNSGQSGAVAELLVSADLLRRGYEVFRSVSQTASCDMVALRDGRCVRIESRMGRYRNDGTVTTPSAQRDAGRFDVMAVLTPDQEIHYFPADF
jgi:hypothetical protein